MAASSPWLAWQLVDSAFPTGGFAHSGGLEAAWQAGAIDALEPWIAEALEHAASTSLPIVLGVFDRPARFAELNAHADAMLANHVANRASRAQGGALLATAAKVFGGAIAELRRNRLDSGQFVHLAPSFGFVVNALGLARDEAAKLFVFQSMRALTSSAVRLGVVGPLEAQAIQHRLAAVADACVARESSRGPEDAAQSNPMLELFQARHDRLYSRLFSS